MLNRKREDDNIFEILFSLAIISWVFMITVGNLHAKNHSIPTISYFFSVNICWLLAALVAIGILMARNKN